jgi:RNA recognition motif-containing protein
VGNLSFKTTQAQLEALFGEVGAVASVFLPTDRTTGRPRGFAFVEFVEGSSATAAIQRLDGYDLDGRALRVNEAQDKPSGPRDFGAARSFAPPPREFSDDAPPGGMLPRRLKSKGSRRNLRARKRSL